MTTLTAKAWMDAPWEETRERLLRVGMYGWLGIGGKKGFKEILEHHGQEVKDYSEWAKLNGRPPQKRVEPDFHLDEKGQD